MKSKVHDIKSVPSQIILHPIVLVVARISREMHNNPFSGSENRQFMKSEQSITGKSNKYSRAAKLTSLLLATACSPTTDTVTQCLLGCGLLVLAVRNKFKLNNLTYIFCFYHFNSDSLIQDISYFRK